MYDSVNPLQIPANAEMVAGYIDGRYMWKAEHWARFPNAVKLQIACFPTTNGGHILDVESGCSTPAEAPGWIRRRQAAGLARPTIYCNRSTLPAVQVACRGLTWDLWLADYTQKPHLYPGSVATQYADPGPVDLSLVSDNWYPGGDLMALTPEEHNMLVDNHNRLTNIEQWAGALQVGGRIDAAIQYAINDPNVGLATLKAELDALKAQLGGLSSVPGPPGKQGDPGPPGPPPAPGTSFTAKIGG